MTQSETSIPETRRPASPQRPSALVILNPAAGSGRADRRFRRVEPVFRSWPSPPRVVRTSHIGDAVRLAAEAPAKTGLVVAAGGDGTANEVANGLLQRPGGQGASVLGYIPIGTGCDLARALGISRDPAAAAGTLAIGNDVMVDIGRIEMATREGAVGRYFLNAANVGAAPAITRRLSRGGWLARLGAASYVVAAAREALSVRPVGLRLTVDSGDPVRESALNISVCNGPSFGGGMRPSPHAGLDTGGLDVVVVGDIGVAEILSLLSHLRRDGVVGRRGVSHFACRSLRIEADTSSGHTSGEMPVEVDGEVPGCLPATFSVVAGGLAVRVPASSEQSLGDRDHGW